MVALVTSTLILAVVLIVPFALAYQRLPLKRPLTWGEAMLAATWAFFVMFWAYGVVPHQWLTLADNEWNWRPDRIYVGPGGIFETLLPFTLNYQVLRDIIAVLIYVVGLGVNVALWALWQDRAKRRDKQAKAAAALTRSTYGRPLVRKG
ncbi:MAG: hypothetical protein ACKVS8_14395 [Phycisphaerales bacterium]